MDSARANSDSNGVGATPTVTIVFLVYNRCAELRTSLVKMLRESDYDADKVDVIVVDNASTDGAEEMVRSEFPEVELIRREENIGASAWNDGFAIARGDYVLVLDDDCYLLPDGLRRAVAAAEEHDADLVSLSVASTKDPDYVFTQAYKTGLLSFWGCAWLIRRHALEALGGYDPEIFIWANELEFMIRFFDRGFKHLHFPEVTAQHMKAPGDPNAPVDLRGYRINARHFAYIAAKLFKPRDAAEAFVALLGRVVRDGLREYRVIFKAIPDTVAGFVHGLRHRQPVENAEISRFYRHNFENFASPWWISRPLPELLRALPREMLRREVLRGPNADPVGNSGRRREYRSERARLYPDEAKTLQF